MADDDGERLDWGNEEDEQLAYQGSYAEYSPRQATGGSADALEDAEDAVSLGGDDDDEREYYANNSEEQATLTGVSSMARAPSSHHGKRDAQRPPASTPSRTPSRAKNSESPTRDSRPPNSAGKLPPAPLMHALPPKPVLVPPLFEQPNEAGILASTMVGRNRKANGGDPLPPDWELKYPRNGGTEPYYYNVKTEECTWVRPRLPTSGRASPSKNSSAQASGRPSPDVQDDAWPERTSRSQQQRSARRDTGSRRTSPPPVSDLSYQDRHYRPGETAASANSGDWRGDRGAGYSDKSYGRGRSVSPQATSDGRRRTRSTSPQWERRGRRELSASPPPDRAAWREPQRDFAKDRQAGVSDSGWSKSQDFPDSTQGVPRSPSTRRARRKDDVEPPIHRRKNDVDPAVRRKDDIEPPIRRRGEPDSRRKDDIEPRIRRKDDIEPPLRRKNDIEPPLRSQPPREQSSRHANDEWPAPRPRSPPHHLRESSPPRHYGSQLPSTGWPNPAQNPPREHSHYARSASPPPGRYRENNAVDILPQRRGRDVDMSDPGFDNSKRRRLNDDLGTSRRGPPESLPVPALPARPLPTDTQERKRQPLPPQREQWRKDMTNPSPAPPPPKRNYPVSDNGPLRIHDNGPASTYPEGDPRYDGPNVPRFKSSPEWGPTGHVKGKGRANISPPDAMDIDMPSHRSLDNTSRPSRGGMYSDRMTVPSPSEAPPRAPRAMARDSHPYAPGPSPVSPTSAHTTRTTGPPAVDPASSASGWGRLRPQQAVPERHWESNDRERRASYSGPSPLPIVDAPRLDGPRDPGERPPGRAYEPELHGNRGRAGYENTSRPPPRMSGTNVTPIGQRPPLQESGLQEPSPSFHGPVNGYEVHRPFAGDRAGDAEPYSGKRRYTAPDESVPPPHRVDRAGRRPSVTQHDSARARAPSDAYEDRAHAPNARQSRFGPSVPANENRVWLTREESEAQEAGALGLRPREDHAPRESRGNGDYAMRDDLSARQRSSPTRTKTKGSWQSSQSQESFGRPPPPPRPQAFDPPEVMRPDRAMTPPPLDRREDPVLVERAPAQKLHPERAQLFGGQGSSQSRKNKGRSNRPPEPAFHNNSRDFMDDRGRDLPPHAVDQRMGPVHDSSSAGPSERTMDPQRQNGSRTDVKRGSSSLLERLSIHEPEHSNSFREKGHVGPHGSVESVPDMRMEPPMDVDRESSALGGDDLQKGGNMRGGGRKKHSKPRRGRRGVA